MSDETWWRASTRGGNCSISKVWVTRSTIAFVIVRDVDGSERSKAISSPSDHYTKSWAEAQAFLVAKADGEVEQARKQLALANTAAITARGLRSPIAVKPRKGA